MAFESWRYLDPALVAERIENGHKLAREREVPLKPGYVPCQGCEGKQTEHTRSCAGCHGTGLHEIVVKSRRNYGNLSAGTLRLVKRMRIQELMRVVKRD